jgi:MFS family permease
LARQTALPPEPRYGWLIVALAPVYLGFGIGSLGAIGVFIKPLGAEFGWLRGETAFAYLAGNGVAGVVGLALGSLADRTSTRLVVALGALVSGLAFLGMAYQRTLWEFYAYAMVATGFASAAYFSPLLANVGGWFHRNRGLALGVATAGQALGQGIVPFLASVLIVHVGWRGAFTAMGLFALCALLPLALLLRTPPPEIGRATANAVEAAAERARQAVPPRVSLSLLAAAAVFCCICMATPIVHVVPLATDRGLAPQTAAGVLLALMVSGFFGRIAFGRLTDSIGGLQGYLLASVWQTATVFWFTQVQTPQAFFLLAVLFGFGYAGVMTCMIVTARSLAPASHAGLATAVAALAGFVGMGIGGFQGGLFFDLTGDYLTSYANAAFAGLYNLVILATLYVYRRQRVAALAPAAQPA